MTGLPPSQEPLGFVRRSRDPPRSRYRGSFRTSLGISAVLHLVAILLYPSFATSVPEVGRVLGGYSMLTPRGTEIVNLVELPADSDPDVLPPEEVLEPDVPAITVEVPSLGPEGRPDPGEPEEGYTGPTIAELLRPRAGDPRIWAPVDRDLIRLTEEERLRLLLAIEIEAMTDSAAIMEELARRAMDWTYTDDEGKKWGVSPGKIHLGDLTLPMPFGFSAPPGSMEEIQGRLWEWDVINRGASSAAARRTWREADEAIRRRKEAARRPDTTRIRR